MGVFKKYCHSILNICLAGRFNYKIHQREKPGLRGTRSDTNRSVQSQKKSRRLKFWIYVEEELYYWCGENKDADQLCSYCTAFLAFNFAYAKIRFAGDKAQLKPINEKRVINWKIFHMKGTLTLSVCLADNFLIITNEANEFQNGNY